LSPCGGEQFVQVAPIHEHVENRARLGHLFAEPEKGFEELGEFTLGHLTSRHLKVRMTIPTFARKVPGRQVPGRIGQHQVGLLTIQQAGEVGGGGCVSTQ
jgi:hypothetical protein